MAKKFLTPVVPPALASDPASGTAGAIYYNTVNNVLKFYNGTTWTAVGTGASSSASAIQALSEAPASPSQGTVYFDITEQTLKAYNGTIWYDVAGPKELIDHQHYAGEGYVRHADYGNYVEFNNVVSMDGGTATTSYVSAPNNDIIDGGTA